MTIIIDGKPCVCQSGEFLLEIAARNGIVIPSLCHHEGLPGQGCCRVCLVEVESGGRRGIVTACVYPVERECDVFTNNENVSMHRGMVLSLLRSLAPESKEIAKLCEEYNAPGIDRFIKSGGVGSPGDGSPGDRSTDDGSPGDRSLSDRSTDDGSPGDRSPGGKCILCGLCVKACESLGTGAIWTMNRGVLKEVATPYNEPSLVCVGCASCASTCPVGAIDVSETDKTRTIWNKTFNLKACAKCGKIMGTQFELGRAAVKADADVPDLCEDCRKKAITDVMAATYGV